MSHNCRVSALSLDILSHTVLAAAGCVLVTAFYDGQSKNIIYA